MEDCIFCKILQGEIPADIIYEDDKVIAFNDIEPQAPIHFLIIPKVHFDSILTVPAGNDIISHIHMVACKLATRMGFAEDGFRIVNNCGEQGGQTVQHLHYHILGGRSMQWPPG